jgi:hypothetical protein
MIQAISLILMILLKNSAAAFLPPPSPDFNQSLLSPPLHYKNQEQLRKDLKLFMHYSYAAKCLSLVQNDLELFNTTHGGSHWRKFPIGNVFEEKYPTIVVKSFHDRKTTTSGYVAFNKYQKIIIVSFRPTVTLTLWKENLKMWKSTPPITFLNLSQSAHPFNISPLLHTHHGFNLDYQQFRADLLREVYSLATSLPSDYRIVFTGHSLGAALAEMAAVDFTLNTLNDSSITNRIWSFPFASPRVGNRHWARFVNSLPFVTNGQSIKMVRWGDPCNQLPPSWMGYEHTFRQIVLMENGDLVPCPNRRLDKLSGECEEAYLLTRGNVKLHLGKSYLKFLGVSFTCNLG